MVEQHRWRPCEWLEEDLDVHAEHLLEVSHRQLGAGSFLGACESGFGGGELILLLTEDLSFDRVVADEPEGEKKKIKL